MTEQTSSGFSRRAFLAKSAGGVAGAMLVPLTTQSIFAATASAATGTEATSALKAHGLDLVRPVAVTSSAGAVSGAGSLVRGGAAVLKAGGTGAAPVVVLDYGRIVGGQPLFMVSKVRGDVTLQSYYSQSLPNLQPAGDAPSSGGAPGSDVALATVSSNGAASGSDTSRLETFFPSGSGKDVIVGHLLQGGQRFQAITLQGTGSIEIELAGFVPSYRTSHPKQALGSFASSDSRLNEIWKLGAHTVDACTVPAGKVPGYYKATADGVLVWGKEYTGYWPGQSWTDYEAAFTVRIVENEAGWVVRSSLFQQGIAAILCASDDRLPVSTPNSIKIFNIKTNAKVAVVKLPFTVRVGKSYRITTRVAGSTLTIAVDGTTVYSGSPSGMAATGFFGFINDQGGLSSNKDLAITDAAGAVLLKESLTGHRTQAFIDACVAGTNSRTVILDGALRDRNAFPGDLGISTKTALAASFDLEAVKGSNELFAAYQLANGTVPVQLPAQAEGADTTGPFGKLLPFFLLDYNTAYFTAAYDIWLRSGDTAWLRRQWSHLEPVLGYLATQVSPTTGLIGGTGAFGGTPLPASCHYYGALLQGAQMAATLGHPTAAASYRAAAAKIGAAVNAQLFDRGLGVYVTTPGTKTVDQQGNGYALLYGLPALDASIDVPALVKNLDRYLQPGSGMLGPISSNTPPFAASTTNVSPYNTSWEILGRLQAGDTDGALRIIRSVWGAMLQQNRYYSGGCWEYINQDTTPGEGVDTSLCHGWSTGPTSGLSDYVLGVRPLTAGFSRFLVEPQPGDLTWAEGTTPTPRGPIRVSWRRSGRSARLTLEVDVPRGTSAYIGLPGKSGDYRVDGRARRTVAVPSHDGRDDYAYFGPFAAGHHRVTVVGGR